MYATDASPVTRPPRHPDPRRRQHSHNGQVKRVRTRALLTLLGLIAGLYLAGCATESLTSTPAPDQVTSAQDYVAGHASDRVVYPKGQRIELKDWRRGIVLQVRVGDKLGTKWQCIVIDAQGGLHRIRLHNLEAAIPANGSKPAPGAYIAYNTYGPFMKDEEGYAKATIHIITEHAVLITQDGIL